MNLDKKKNKKEEEDEEEEEDDDDVLDGEEDDEEFDPNSMMDAPKPVRNRVHALMRLHVSSLEK